MGYAVHGGAGIASEIAESPANFGACHAWGRCDGRDCDVRRMFYSFCVLENQQLITKTTHSRYWNVGDHPLDEDQVGEVVEKFTDLSIVQPVQL